MSSGGEFLVKNNIVVVHILHQIPNCAEIAANHQLNNVFVWWLACCCICIKHPGTGTGGSLSTVVQPGEILQKKTRSGCTKEKYEFFIKRKILY